MIEKLRLTAIDLVKHYHLQLLAVALFVYCVSQLVWIRPLERAVVPGVGVLFGLIATLAPEEVSDWTGHFRWTTQQYHSPPATAVRFAGLSSLIVATVYLL